MDAKTRLVIRLYKAGRRTGADVLASLGAAADRADLLEALAAGGVDVPSGLTDDELRAAIENGGYVLTPIERDEPEPEQESTDAENEPESEPESAEKALADMTKAELLEYAQEHGVEVYESWTKAEIIAAIEAA